MQYSALLVAAGLLAPQVHADALWGKGGSSYCAPGNNPPSCSPEQSGSYNWHNAPQGPLNSYDKITCQGGWNVGSGSPSYGKRAIRGLTRRGDSPCAAAPLKNHPSYGCPDLMSPSTYHISGSHPSTNFTAVYDVGNGNTCTQDHSCGPEGAVVTNSQCGRAKSVTFQPKPGSEDCTLSVYTISFHCSTATQASSSSTKETAPPQSYTHSQPESKTSSSSVQTYTHSSPASSSSSSTPVTSDTHSSPPTASSTPVTSYTHSSPPASSSTPESSSTPVTSYTHSSPPTASSTPVTSYTHSSPPASSSTPVTSYTHSSPPASSSTPVTSYTHSSPPESSTTTPAPTTSSPVILTTSTVYTTTEHTVTSCHPSITNCPAESHSTYVITSTIALSTTICPVTETETSKPATSTSYSASSPPASSKPESSSSYSALPPPSSSKPESSSSYSAVPPPSSSKPTASTSYSAVPPPSSSKPESSSSYTAVPPPSSSKPTASTSYSAVPPPSSSKPESSSTYSASSPPASSTQQSSSYKASPPPSSQSSVYSTSSQPTVTTQSSSYSAQPPPPAPTAQCPAQVPMCINTHWTMIEADCKDNTDMNCYCVKPEFTKQVMACLEAYCPDDATKTAAFSCFAGICAPHLGHNPNPFTGIPDSITCKPEPSATVPYTTVTMSTVITAPCTYSTGPSVGQPIPSSSTVQTINTVATVPQVGFSTAAAATGSGAAATGAAATPAPNLYQGAPAPQENVANPTPSASSGAAATGGSAANPAGSSNVGAPAATASIAQGAASSQRAPIVAVLGAIVVSALML